MTIIQKLITALKDYGRAFGLGRNKSPSGINRHWPEGASWRQMTDAEFNDALADKLGLRRVVTITPAAMVNIRLAEIAKEIADLIADIPRRKEKKVAWLKPLQALRREQMALESGRLVWKDGAWVKKELA